MSKLAADIKLSGNSDEETESSSWCDISSEEDNDEKIGGIRHLHPTVVLTRQTAIRTRVRSRIKMSKLAADIKLSGSSDEETDSSWCDISSEEDNDEKVEMNSEEEEKDKKMNEKLKNLRDMFKQMAEDMKKYAKMLDTIQEKQKNDPSVDQP